MVALKLENFKFVHDINLLSNFRLFQMFRVLSNGGIARRNKGFAYILNSGGSSLFLN